MESSLLNLVLDEAHWQEFFAQKKERGFLSSLCERELNEFILNKRFIDIGKNIAERGFYFERPQKKLINKLGTNKKRTVYSFCSEQTIVLKFIAHKLHTFDNYFCPLCFSFRQDLSVRRAIGRLLKSIRGKKLYCYKVDISNYFNSIDVEQLIQKLDALFGKDTRLKDFFRDMLLWEDGSRNGVMAGTPTSPFLSNVFLTDLDTHFYRENVPYARYCDDIIVFAQTLDELKTHIDYIKDTLKRKNLVINRKKEQIVEPEQPWQFLGVEYFEGKIDLSPISVDKMKAKIRRKARSIARWASRKGVERDKAVEVMVRAFNKKFFLSGGRGELTWSRWYFPLLTTDKGLKKIDEHLVMWLRYLKTHRHSQKNIAKVPYQNLKELGYISLVRKFYEKKKLATFGQINPIEKA